LSIARNGSEAFGREIQAPNALVIEVTEVQRAVGTDHQAIRVVDLAVGISGRPGTDESSDAHGRRESGGGYHDAQRHECLHAITSTLAE
jgi:hypothetical protein